MNNFKCWHVTKDSVIVTLDSGVKTVRRDSEEGKKALLLIADNRLDELPVLLDMATAIGDKSNQLFYVKDGIIFSFGERVSQSIASKVIEFTKEGLPFDYLLKFWNNLKYNSSEHIRNHLPEFLEANDYSITQDGMFIAYKRVRNNWKDCWTGTMDNSVGKIVEMRREDCNPDPKQDCASGLHAAPFDYAVNFYQSQYTDGHVIELLINPIDVMAVPEGCGSIKIRACKYIVVGCVDEKPKKKSVSEVKVSTNDKSVTAIIIDGKLVFGKKPIATITKEDTMELLANYTAKSAVNLQEGFVVKPLDFFCQKNKTEKPFVKYKPVKTPLVVTEMKLGNFKYVVTMITEDEKVKFLKDKGFHVYNSHMKPSSWPKSFVSFWSDTIDNVKRYGKTYRHQYVVTLKNGSIFNITSK